MALGTKICKICGKEYGYCKSFGNSDLFRWQDVACCPEHAAEYFAKIAESRKADAEKSKKEVEAPKAETPKKATKSTKKKTSATKPKADKSNK